MLKYNFETNFIWKHIFPLFDDLKTKIMRFLDVNKFAKKGNGLLKHCRYYDVCVTKGYIFHFII